MLSCVLSEQTEYNCWKPTVCMNFCCDFLSFVKHVATEDNPRLVAMIQTTVDDFNYKSTATCSVFLARLLLMNHCFPYSVVYLFSWEPHRDVTYSIHKDSQYSFLPHWYIEEMTSNQDSHNQS